MRRLEVFKTRDRGWSVRTLDTIPAHSFVVAFPGLVRRNEECGEEDDDSYFFDMWQRTDFDEQGRRVEGCAGLGRFGGGAVWCWGGAWLVAAGCPGCPGWRRLPAGWP